MSGKIRILVVGCGQMGGSHARAYHKMDDFEIAGVISQRDIFYGALAWSVGLGSAAHDKALAAVPVKQVMQGDVVTVAPETSLSEAARLMLESRVGCLPVVAAGRLVGHDPASLLRPP